MHLPSSATPPPRQSAADDIPHARQEEVPLARVTVRALIIAMVLTVLCGFWIKFGEIVNVTCQVTESVPAVPAVGILILLVLLRPIVGRLGKAFRLESSEIVVVYCFALIATSVAGCGIVRFMLSLITAPFYFATPENQFGKLLHYIPTWLVPHNELVLRGLYEGSDSGKVPWLPWLMPLLVWTGFLLVLWWVMFCMVVLVRKQWVEKERLTFPLLYLPLEMLDDRAGTSDQPTFFKDPVMWCGFGIAAVYNLLNILHAYNPSVVAPGKYFDLGALFTDRPLNALQPLQLHYRPELVGFGYLVSTEVSFSIWFFYLANKVLAVIGRMVGYEAAGFPFVQEQSIGAYIAVALVLLWISRHQLREAYRRAFFSDLHIDESGEPIKYRTAFFGLIAGSVLLCVFCRLAGMAVWVAAVYLGLVLAVALVYSRIRAETGVPLMWMFPFYMQKKVMLYSLGSAPFLAGGSASTLTMFAMLTFLSRGYFPELIGYQIEELKLAQQTRINPRHMAGMMVFALVFGLGAAYYFHLTPYYLFGAGTLRNGIWGTGISTSEYTDIITFMKTPKAPDVPRILFTVVGFVVALGLSVARMVFLKFPLHPLGYCMATAYGDLIWWSFFLVWVIKSAVFKVGGVKLYKRLIPGFLGFAVGHFFTAGMVWGMMGMHGGQVFERYGVWFG